MQDDLEANFQIFEFRVYNKGITLGYEKPTNRDFPKLLSNHFLVIHQLICHEIAILILNGETLE